MREQTADDVAVAAPQLFQTSDAPRFRHGFTAHLCLYVVFVGEIVVTRLLLMRRNKLKAAASASGAEEVSKNKVQLKLRPGLQEADDARRPQRLQSPTACAAGSHG